MRKRMFFAVVLSLCVANFGAFAATARNSNKNVSASATQSNNNVARSATRATRVTTTTQSVQQKPVSTTNTTQAVVARAGAKQKALNTGTKVSAATENTAVPQECQEAFYGCMDSFCMLDNASGGRCQCSDRVIELDGVLDDILNLDEQTYIMATEGVERIQMGEAEKQIMARAKAAGDKVVAENKSEANKKQARKLDLSAWNDNIFTLDDDVFDSFDNSDSISTFADKKGDALYKASAKMCAAQISEKCVSYTSMLQLVYAQKIKSDCIAYENSLKAQKSQSQQKLLTAQKALRDAALDEYQTQNKYKTVGECTIAFTECMQTTAECGTDYTGCVTLAAQENVRNNKSGSKSKQTKIKGAVSGADITLSSTTLEQLLAKKTICESVTKQCVNVNKNDAVWTAFLRNAAPALKSAELIAEQNLRSNCIPTIAECYKNSCKAQFGDNDETYDMCLSNPLLYKSLCKVQLEPCLEATGGTYDDPTQSSLWNALVALLNAMKVDACTAEIKSCITERCGDDYSECIGLDTVAIGNLCPIDKLTACVSDGKYADGKDGTNTAEIREYIAEIAQGLALQIDNALATACQNALNEAMIKVCGDTENCDAIIKDDNIGSHSLKYEICEYKIADDGGVTWTNNCRGSMEGISKADLTDRQWASRLSGIIYWDDIMDENGEFVSVDEYINNNSNFTEYDRSVIKDRIFGSEIASVKAIINNAINSIESDPNVIYCKSGRQVPGFSNENLVRRTSTTGRFPNLTKQVRQVIMSEVISRVRENYLAKYDEAVEQMMQDQIKVAEFTDNYTATSEAKETCAKWAQTSVLPVAKKTVNTGATAGLWIGAVLTSLIPYVGPAIATPLVIAASIKTDKDKKDKAANNSKETAGEGTYTVEQWNYIATINTMFDETTGVCTKETISRTCVKENKAQNKCKEWGEKTETIKTLQLL